MNSKQRKFNWKRALIRFGWTLLILIALVNIVILVTGRFYIYKAFANTVMMGRFGPAIDEHEIFYNRPIATHEKREWKTHPDYASNEILPGHEEKLRSIGTVSYLVVYKDSLYYEKYWDGFDQKSVTNSFSVAKSIVSLLIGIAIDEGLIESVNDPAGKYLEAYADGDKAKITILHLLTMSSGLDWSESGSDPFSDNAEAYYGWDLEDQMNALEVKEEPGIHFEYMSCNTQILAMILKKTTGVSVSEYLQKKIWKPMGMTTDALWNLDDEDGTEKAFCCLYATARDFARIGALYLNNGVYNGKQIVSEEYIRQSLRKAPLTNEQDEPVSHYGYSWWLDNYKGHDFFYARGILGQYIICLPHLDMVIVRAGHERGEKLENDHPEDIYWYIDAALEMLP